MRAYTLQERAKTSAKTKQCSGHAMRAAMATKHHLTAAVSVSGTRAAAASAMPIADAIDPGCAALLEM
jgi:hypothetical protein